MISIEEIQNNYYNSQVEECLKKAIQFRRQNTDLNNDQLAAQYIGRSYFELNNPEKAKEVFENLIIESRNKKGSTIEEVDVLIRIIYQEHLFNLETETAEENNKELLNICEQYKEQNQHSSNYNYGIYLYGIAVYKFIENYRDNSDLESINILKQALDQTSQHKNEIMNMIGCIYNDKDLFKEAIFWTESLYNINPKLTGVANNLAMLYEEDGQLEKAEQLYHVAESLTPRNIIILNNIAHFYLEKQQNFELAIKYLNKCLEIDPQNLQTLFDLGCLLYEQYEDQKIEGINKIRQTLDLDPDFYRSYMYLSDVEINDNLNIQKGIEYLNQCLERNPKSGYVQFLLGEKFYTIAENHKAMQCFLYALKQKLTIRVFQDCSHYLALTYSYLERYEDSLKTILSSVNFRDFGYDDIVQEIIFIINLIETPIKSISDDILLSIINSYYGPIQMKFKIIISELKVNKKVKNGMEEQLQRFSQSLQLIAYNRYILPYLTYQNEISHWDLFID